MEPKKIPQSKAMRSLVKEVGWRVQDLTEEYNDLFDGCDFSRFSDQEVASLTKISESAVSEMIDPVMEKLRTKLVKNCITELRRDAQWEKDCRDEEAEDRKREEEEARIAEEEFRRMEAEEAAEEREYQAQLKEEEKKRKEEAKKYKQLIKSAKLTDSQKTILKQAGIEL